MNCSGETYWPLRGGTTLLMSSFWHHGQPKLQDQLPAVKARVAVEAGIKLGWEHYVGLEGAVVGMEGFGASAPASVLYEKFGITVEAVVRSAKELLRRA